MRGRRDSAEAPGREASMKRERARTRNEEPSSGIDLPDVTRILAGAADVPRDFVAALYGHAAPEDLVHYSSIELATLGKTTFEDLQERVPGEPKIRIENPATISEGGRHFCSIRR
jgi:hypothetical protein